MSIFNPSMSLNVIKKLEGEMTQKCIANIPTETPCEVCGGPDAYLGGGYDITCPACDEGVVVTNTQSAFNARVTWVSGVGIEIIRGIVAGGEMGDVLLQAGQTARPILEAVRKAKDAYIMVDGTRVRPRDISQNRADRPTTIVVACDVVRDNQ